MRGMAYADHKKDYDRAITDYNKAIELDPKYVLAYNNRGRAYADNKKDYDRAITDYNKAIELDPKYAYAYNNRGRVYAYNKKDYDRAITDYNRAIELDPKYVHAYNNRGSAYENKKDANRAIADYNKALALDPNNSFASDGLKRLQELKKQQVTSPVSKHEQPTALGGMLRCESHSERTACELDTSCSWADGRKQCERKSGSLATAMLEASPATKPALASAAPCVETLVGSEKRCLKAGDSFKDCPECPEMVVVPAGEFMMGSPAKEEGRDHREEPQRKVTIGRPFAVGIFEVTFAEWDACVAAGGCKHRPGDEGWGRGRRPVINVSWDNISEEFLPWLSRKTGKIYRLLTEAEWEYSVRAGSTTPFSTGWTITSDEANFDGHETYGRNANGQFRQKTLEVGSFKPNEFRLFDMHGNIFEWVEDCHATSQPTDSSVCIFHVIRGGSWHSRPSNLRSASRTSVPTITQNTVTGFRLARAL